MRQVSRSECEKIETSQLQPLLIGVFAGDLSTYQFVQKFLEWTENLEIMAEHPNQSVCHARILLSEERAIFRFEAFESYTNLYLLLPQVDKKYLPELQTVVNFITDLTLEDAILWFNFWWFLPITINKEDLKTQISIWFYEDCPIESIYQKTIEKTGLDDYTVKHLLASHPTLSGKEMLSRIM